jgi:hypothetical protein
MIMDRIEIEELKEKVGCAAILSHAGFALDRRESTRRALKFRRADEIIIVVHNGRGWWDPHSEARGDVFRLVRHLERLRFPEALERVHDIAGLPTPDVELAPRRGRLAPDVGAAERWASRRPIRPSSSAWRYLTEQRAIPADILAAATAQGLLRQGPRGSAWMCHADAAGAVVGWEERGPTWRGFATGGHKTLFRFGRPDAGRICVTEAAIDALSLASIESVRLDTLYVSTGGGWSPTTDAVLRALATGRVLVSATDRDEQGDAYAERLRALASGIGAPFQRLHPIDVDWNEEVKKRGWGGASGGPPGSRVTLRPLRGP